MFLYSIDMCLLTQPIRLVNIIVNYWLLVLSNGFNHFSFCFIVSFFLLVLEITMI